MLDKDTKKIFAIALPAALNNFLDMLQILVDMLFIGRISPQAIAGVGLSMQLIGFLYAFITIFSVGTNSVIAQFVGAKRINNAKVTTFTNAIVSLIFSIPFTIFLFLFSKLFFSTFTDDEIVLNLSSDYMKVISLSVPFLFIGAVFVSTSNGYGDTKTPLIIGIVGNIINTILDYLLIFGNFGFPRLEVVGAAVATTIAYVSEVVIYLVLIYKRQIIGILPLFNKKVLKKTLQIGIPSSLERIIIYSSFMFFVWVISQYGVYTLAGYQIGLRIEGLAFMPGFGFAIAAMTLVGQSIGEKNILKAKKLGLKTAYISAFIMQTAGVFIFLFSDNLANIFTNDPKTIKEASLYLKVVAISQFPLAIDFVLSGALRGAGASKISLAVNTLCLWIFRLIPAFIITITLKDLFLVYLIMVIETFIKGFVIWYIFAKNKWIRGIKYA
ncbi:MAG: MATE family efflux transporter [Hydrogenothermus sp.]|nr:MAG: MATE family efflux transporter [Hydrogenothermus sp.]